MRWGATTSGGPERWRARHDTRRRPAFDEAVASASRVRKSARLLGPRIDRRVRGDEVDSRTDFLPETNVRIAQVPLGLAGQGRALRALGVFEPEVQRQ